MAPLLLVPLLIVLLVIVPTELGVAYASRGKNPEMIAWGRRHPLSCNPLHNQYANLVQRIHWHRN